MKIKEYNLIKISFIGFLLLFILLFYLDSIYSPKLVQISKLDKSYFNKVVKINAKIEKQTLNGQTLFLILQNLENKSIKIKGIIFNINKTFSKSKDYQIIGRISLYKNDLEILIEEINSI